MHNIGWARRITDKLAEYELETNWDYIKRISPNEWKEKVRVAVLKKNEKKNSLKTALAWTVKK